MIEIKIEDREIKEYLGKMLVLDLTPLMRNIAGIMHHAVEENFRQEGRPKWTSLSERTKKAREKKGYWPGKILQMRGQLAASISQRHTENMAVVGTNLHYAGIHQFGGRAGRKHRATIPARPFLKLTDKDIEDIKEAVVNYLRRW